VQDGSVFLDVGANLGFFSLKIADHVRRHGRVFAFEPHPLLAALLGRSAFLNKLDGVITVSNFGLSDHDRPVEFSFPKSHLGGGRLGRVDDPTGFDVVPGAVRKLDSLFDTSFVADLVKMDIEGHELAALRGMRAFMARSPRLKLMFEKLGLHGGYEPEIEKLFQDLGFELHGVYEPGVLKLIRPGELALFSGYALAARPGQVGESDRRRFWIYPSQLSTPGVAPKSPGDALVRQGAPGEILFHGPYWYLRRGVWNLHVHGEIGGALEVTVAERFGHETRKFTVSGRDPVARFVNERDLVQFELIGRPTQGPVKIEIASLELARIG
jgi:FkbM family methyltransferase